MTRKKFILTIALPVALSIAAAGCILYFHNSIGIKSNAYSLVASEKSDMSSSISELKNEKTELTDEQSGYDKTIQENYTLINEVDSLYSQLEGYETDIQNAQALSTELDSQLESKKAYLDGLEQIPEESEGKTITLKEGEHKCPSDIKAARYKAEGTGKLYIYNIAGSLKTSVKDLSTMDSHSYTFEISSGEKIKTEGDITLTEITE